MTDEDMQVHIDTSLEFDDEELLESIAAAEADLKNGKRILPPGSTSRTRSTVSR